MTVSMKHQSMIYLNEKVIVHHDDASSARESLLLKISQEHSFLELGFTSLREHPMRHIWRMRHVPLTYTRTQGQFLITKLPSAIS